MGMASISITAHVSCYQGTNGKQQEQEELQQRAAAASAAVAAAAEKAAAEAVGSVMVLVLVQHSVLLEEFA